MAIAIDTTSLSGAWNNNESSVTWSHNCGGSNRTLVVFVETHNSDKATGVTYNGVSMTKQGAAVSYNNSTRWVTAWVLINPASGANNIVATLSATDYVKTSGISLTDTKQSVQPQSYLSRRGDASGTVDATITTTGVCWLIMGADNGNSGAAGTGTTAIYIDELRTFRSNASVSAGSNSLQMTGTTNLSSFNMLAIEEGIAAAANIPDARLFFM